MTDWSKHNDVLNNFQNRFLSEPKTFRLDNQLLEQFAEQRRQHDFHENPILAIRPAIEQQIKAFEAELEKLEDPSLYVGLWVASFGQQRLILVQKIEFEEPCLIVFHGFSEDKSPLKLIQHVSQLNFLLEARKYVSAEPRRSIGFLPNVNP